MPSKTALSIQPPATVVVTGANGFIAQHCISLLLDRGYHVIGTTRTAAKCETVRAAHNSHPKLDLVVVEHIACPRSYQEALADAAPAAILHIASPFRYNACDFEADLLIPAVRGSTAILEAATGLETVKRVVQTNSFACIYDAGAGPRPDKTYTARDWSPLRYEDGLAAGNASVAYRASKAAAEKAAWAFMDERRLGFDLVSLCPAMVFGPFLPSSRPSSIEEVNTSNLLVWSAISSGCDSPVPPTKGPVWVDVRDVAEAHVRALQVAEAGGGRFLLGKGVYCNQELADVSRRVAAKYGDRIPVGEPGRRESHTHFQIDASETERVLGVKWRGLDECLVDLVPQLFEIEQLQEQRQGKNAEEEEQRRGRLERGKREEEIEEGGEADSA